MLRRALLSSAALVVLASTVLVAAAAPAHSTAVSNGRIAYSSWDAGLNYDIYTVDPADPSAPPAQLTNDGRYDQDPDWSPDGTKIAFDGWGAFSGPRIQVMDADPATNDWHVLSDPCAPDAGCYGDFQPAWSPDGTRIAFVSTRPNPDGTDAGYELYVMDASGEKVAGPATRLTTDVPDEFGFSPDDSQPTWSPDGSRIAFLSTGRGASTDSCDLWVMDSKDRDGDGFGDNLSRLTFDDGYNCDAFDDVGPQWSPNSSLIAFTSTRSGNFDIWVVNANDPTDLRQVTDTPGANEDQPSWSPDGAWIVFRSDVSGAEELYSLPVPAPASPAGGSTHRVRGSAPAPNQLTFDGAPKQQADWGPAPSSGPRTVLLKVSTRGRGRIRTAPSGIACGIHCAATFVAKTKVTLRAVPRAGYRFAGWRGACGGTGPACVLRLTSSKSVVARFVERT